MLKNFFRREHWWYAAVLCIAVFVIFFRLDRADMQTDGAVYSVRALGYLDYLNTDIQSTPLQWFDQLPWWTKLSFHDAPPLALAIQFVFFTSFGHSTLVARIPGALAGVASVALVLAIAQRLWGQAAGITAGLLTASSTLFTSAVREPYLEGVETFFILLCLWCFLRALERPRWWPAWGASLGLALLTKYTAVLLLPATVGFAALSARPAFRDRRFWGGLALALALVSPVVVYNLQLYRTRGHFDLQLSKLVPSTWPAARQAWPKLYQDVGKPKPWRGYAVSTFQYFRATASAPWFWLAAAAVAWWTWQLISSRKFYHKPVTVVWLGLVAFVGFLVFNGPAPRFLPPAVPLLALLSAAWLAELKQAGWGRTLSYAAAAILAVVVAVEGFVNVNTHLTREPRGSGRWHLNTLRLGNDGFQQLAAYLEPIFQHQPGYHMHPVRSRDDLLSGFDHVSGQDVFLYQGDVRWFSAFWYFQQYSVYRNLYILSERDLAGVASAMGRNIEVVKFFRALGARRLRYIAGVTPGVFESGYDPTSQAQRPRLVEAFADNLRRGAPGGTVEIKNPNGQVAFRVYTLDFTAAPDQPP